MPYTPVPLRFETVPPEETRRRAFSLLEALRPRRSVRDFASDPVPDEVLEALVATAAQAPSGANRQPWRFVVVRDPATKRRIREAAEKEERESYDHRMPPAWREALEPLGTDWRKPFLEVAPALVVAFRKDWELVGGERRSTYYPSESIGIACGFLIAAIHLAGLATLTHTPSPMNFLGEILGARPGEKAYLLLPVGYPAPDAVVPDVTRKPLEEVLTWA
ncbi:MAG: nitroreductase family protein [Acidobacteria bacterium]|nr:MAG: nitroreductase family protein [Acidobacteriota bacterium]MCE7958445.1 nitroreductase family protein [Acidobacteria bacterium ACB2]